MRLMNHSDPSERNARVLLCVASVCVTFVPLPNKGHNVPSFLPPVEELLPCSFDLWRLSGGL